jgi:shikimate dehydrogenase
VLVSTVPTSAQVPELVAAMADIPLVFDVVYDPWPTPLATAAERSGRTVLSGLDLLVAQAVDQVVAMTGRRDVPAGAMRRAAEQELAARSRL